MMGPWGLCLWDRELYRSLILNSGGVGWAQQELSINYGDGRVAHGDCVSWAGELYRKLNIKLGGVGWAQQELSINYGDVGGPMGIVYHG